MNKIISIIIVLLFSRICVAQIGINTENPQTPFHVDGASTAATENPSIGIISEAQSVDDVVITASGNMGVGTISPRKKVHIISPNQGKALKIVDNRQGRGKALVSNADGAASWTPILGSWYGYLRSNWPYVFQTTSTLRRLTNYNGNCGLSDPLLGAVDAAAGSIKVPFTGMYLVSISGQWISNRVEQAPYRVSLIILRNTMLNVWYGSATGYSKDWAMVVTFTALLQFNAGDLVSLAVDENQSYSANNCYGNMSFIIEFLYE